MKLNNNGWGLSTELVFLLIFVICLIIATIGLYKANLLQNINESLNPNYYNNTDTTPKVKFSYDDVEEELINATKNYISDIYNNKLGLDTLIIKVSLLKNREYLTGLKDENNEECSGYCEAYLSDDNNIIYEPYIKCKKYKTDGYLERKDN